jgi:hypothetical protein
MRPILACLALSAVVLGGCANGAKVDPNTTRNFLPSMGWDHRPEAKVWTAKSLAVVAANDARLATRIPGDITTFCPGYSDATVNDRRAFWAGLVSATAKHESTWNPQAAGGGGRWIGLMQISPQTARAYQCDAKTAGALKNGEANLACAIRIMSAQVDRDGVVAGGGARGIGRDWAPFRSPSKRADIAAWTKSQDYCQG